MDRRALFILFCLSLTVAPESRAASPFCGMECSADQQLKKWLESQKSTQQTGMGPFPACTQEPSFLSVASTGGKIVDAARRVMAMMYGSCGVLELPVREKIETAAKFVQGYKRVPAIAAVKKGIAGFRRESIQPSRGIARGVVSQHPYLHQRLEALSECDPDSACGKMRFKRNYTPKSCQDFSCFSLHHPPVYQWGARPSGGRNGEPISLQRNASQDNASRERAESYRGKSARFDAYWQVSSGIDCSSFISMALISRGLKLDSGRDKGLVPDEIGSNGFLLHGKKNGCLKTVVNTGRIQPGDIVASRSHVLMIDTVGDDPFLNEQISQWDVDEMKSRLERARSTGRGGLQACKSLSLSWALSSPVNFEKSEKCLENSALAICDEFHSRDTKQSYRVTVIHSAANGNVGVQRQSLQDAIALGQPLAESIATTAKVDCVRRLKTRWHTESLGGAEPTQRWKAWLERSGYEARIQASSALVMRHSGTPQCTVPTNEIPKIEGWDCAQCCKTDSTYESMTGGENDG